MDQSRHRRASVPDTVPARDRRALWPAVVVAFAVATLAVVATPAVAGEADVTAVRASREPGGTWRFDVTIRSRDRGWDYYCDRFEVVSPDGTVLGARVLLHPHDDEQPFTRELTGVKLPRGIRRVVVRAAMKPGGAGGDTRDVAVEP